MTPHDIITASAAVIVPVITAATVYLRLAMRTESLQTRMLILGEVENKFVRRETCKLIKRLGGCSNDSQAHEFTD